MDKPNSIKVCFVAPKAYPIFNPEEGTYFGGAEVDLYYLATELAKDADFEVSFLVADYGQAPVEIHDGVTVLKTVNFRKNPFTGCRQVWRGLNKANAHIYFTKTACMGNVLVAVFCKMRKKAFVYRTAHTYECDGTYLREHLILGRAFNWSLRQAKLLFAQNAVDADNLSKNINVSSQIIPNGHRLPPLSPQFRGTILWVGRDADFKKPFRFLELAKAVPSEHFTMICQTLTNDRSYTDLVARAAQIKNLEFIKHVPFNEIDSYYQKAKVFVNTSDAEGFPNTFIQACKFAVPVLSFNVNPDDFLNKHSCGLCSDASEQRLLDNLKFLLAENRYREIGLNGRKYVEENHDIKKIIEEYKDIFTRFIRNV